MQNYFHETHCQNFPKCKKNLFSYLKLHILMTVRSSLNVCRALLWLSNGHWTCSSLGSRTRTSIFAFQNIWTSNFKHCLNLHFVLKSIALLNNSYHFNFRINRNGTCFTSTECEEKGGSASGNCASGFGVCCLFTIGSSSSSGTTVTVNNTYIQNPSFPAVYSETSAVTYTVNKCADSK